MPKLPLSILFVTLFLRTAVLSQTATSATAPPPQLSPKAAYDDAVRPLQLTRQSVSNWSDTETAALTVSMARAKADCAARDPNTFTSADLIDLARLCALGQNFPAVIHAAARYIAADTPKPQLTQAYASLIDAQLHTKDESAAFASAQAMLAAVPYDTLTAEALDEAINFMQFVYTPDALTLALAREPQLLDRIRATATGVSPAPSYPGAEPPQSLHELYAGGIALAALQQLARARAASITATLTALDDALPAALTPDDAIPIAITRRRYALLGQPLPNLNHPIHPTDPRKPVALATLDLPSTLPELPARNAITALLLFPDWCAQCIRMYMKLPQTVFTVASHEAYLYGLLAQTVKPNPPSSAPAVLSAITAADATNYLRGTPTLIIDPSFLDQFGADDVPFLILTDSQGILRVLQPVSEDAINPGGTIDAAIAHVGALWPSPHLKSAPTPPAKTPPPAARH